jgi:SAM-dependent methyltransferase
MMTTTRETATTQHDADERLRTEFNDWAKAGRGEGMERGHRPAGEQAIALMKISPGARVLDVGCGSGWATRLLAEQADGVSAVGIDISDDMITLAQQSTSAPEVTFRVATAERLPFADGEFSDAFSMESLYYYQDMLSALREIKRVLRPGGQFVSVVDLYQENEPSHRWVSQLKVPVKLLSVAEYREVFEQAGFTNVSDRRLYDPTPVPEDYSGGSFETRDELIEYRNAGSLLVRGEA